MSGGPTSAMSDWRGERGLAAAVAVRFDPPAGAPQADGERTTIRTLALGSACVSVQSSNVLDSEPLCLLACGVCGVCVCISMGPAWHKSPPRTPALSTGDALALAPAAVALAATAFSLAAAAAAAFALAFAALASAAATPPTATTLAAAPAPAAACAVTAPVPAIAAAAPAAAAAAAAAAPAAASSAAEGGR